MAPEEAGELLDRLCQAFAAIEHGSDAGRFVATFSAGIAGFPEHPDPGDLTDAADRRLYAAKRGGRNRVELDV